MGRSGPSGYVAEWAWVASGRRGGKEGRLGSWSHRSASGSPKAVIPPILSPRSPCSCPLNRLGRARQRSRHSSHARQRRNKPFVRRAIFDYLVNRKHHPAPIFGTDGTALTGLPVRERAGRHAARSSVMLSSEPCAPDPCSSGPSWLVRDHASPATKTREPARGFAPPA